MKYLISTLIILGLISLGGWMYFFTKPALKTPEKKVAATIYPLYDIVRQIAKDKLEVIPILPPGSDPHNYNPTPQDIFNLNQSLVVFSIGHNLDSWITKTAKEANVKAIIPVDKNIQIQPYPEDKSHKNPSDDDDHQGDDPHYWLSLANAQIITQNVADALSEIDSTNQDFYQTNAQKYIQEIQENQIFLQGKINESGVKSIATMHNGWRYFAASFGLEVATTFEPMPGEEPTPAYLKDFQQAINQYHLSTVFSEPQLSNKSIKALQNDLKITIRVLDPIGGTIDRDTYLGLMRYNVGQIIAK